MVRLRVLEILKEQWHTKYWLYKRMDILSYKNFQNIIENKTSSIRYKNIEKLSIIKRPDLKEFCCSVIRGETFRHSGKNSYVPRTHLTRKECYQRLRFSRK